MGGLLYASCVLVAAILGAFLMTRDPVVCVVVGDSSISGYYAASDGIYTRRGEPLDTLPDLLSILQLRRELGEVRAIALTASFWGIFYDDKCRHHSRAGTNLTLYLNSPPSSHWLDGDGSAALSKESSAVRQVTCRGDLCDAPVPRMRQSNLDQLVAMPATCLLLLLLLGVAAKLWRDKVPVDAVSFSYHSTVVEGEYWRFVTASLSHFDPMHLLFNMSSLYQLGSLEALCGSAYFLYLNLALVGLTMLTCVALSHLLIHYFGRQELVRQQSVGFSCVLFAWMVVAAVLQSSYCPVFFLPNLCFSTWSLALPGIPYAVPLNLGPFVLLVVTKFILPRSSLLGHFAGIVIGYLLAWQWLSWLSPSLYMALAALALLGCSPGLHVWDFSAFRSDAVLSEFVPPHSLGPFHRLWVLLALYAIAILPCPLVLGVLSFVPMFIAAVLVCLALEARRCEWVTDSAAAHERCSAAIQLALSLVCGLLLHDALSLGAALGGLELLVANLHDAAVNITAALFYRFAVLVLELAMAWHLVLLLQSFARPVPLLQLLRLAPTDGTAALRAIGVPGHVPFAGRANVLTTNATVEEASKGGKGGTVASPRITSIV